MFTVGRLVWVKRQERLARVSEAFYLPHGTSRRAAYIIDWADGGGGSNFLTGSDNLRAADACCDGCGKWLPNSSFNGGISNEYIGLCFLCKLDNDEALRQRELSYL